MKRLTALVWTFPSLILLGAMVMTFGCSTSNSLIQPEQLMKQDVIEPGADLETLRRGRAIAVTECTGCHRLYWPNEYPPSEWVAIVRKMGGRASLSDTQIRDLQAYYVSASRAAQATPGEK